MASITRRQLRVTGVLVIILVLVALAFQQAIINAATSMLLAIVFGLFTLTLVSVLGTYLNTKRLVEQFDSVEELLRVMLSKEKS